MTGAWRLRAAVLTLAGAMMVHQGRYMLAPPGHEHELAGVHQYLAWLMPLAAALLFVAVAQFVVWIRRAEGADAPALPSAAGLWAGATGSLLTVFGVQETLELATAHGQLPGLGAVLGHLGWQVLPLALAVGGLLALLLAAAARVADSVFRRHRHEPRRSPRPAPIPLAPALAARGPVLARFLAGRAPPPLS